MYPALTIYITFKQSLITIPFDAFMCLYVDMMGLCEEFLLIECWIILFDVPHKSDLRDSIKYIFPGSINFLRDTNMLNNE